MRRPNFCAECGERLLSRRRLGWFNFAFCPACAQKARRAAWNAWLLIGAALFGVGYAVGRWSEAEPPPLVIERAASRVASSASAAPAAQPAESERVYLCGARTKKGTPCQRRVRSQERCWQHRGKPAMLPPEKLVVQ